MPKPTRLITLPSGREIEIAEHAVIAGSLEELKLIGEEVITKRLIAAGYKPDDKDVKLTTVNGRQVYRKQVTPRPI